MNKCTLFVIAGLLVGCSGKIPILNLGEPKQVVVRITATPIVLRVTETPIKQVVPTPTHLPGWCYQDPTLYLEECMRIVTEMGNAIQSWNSSPRRQGDLLATESSVRSLIRQAESLEAPDDFEIAHEHFLNAMHGTLHALFGITDNSDANRIGNDVTRNRQLELTGETVEQALAERDTVCWQE